MVTESICWTVERAFGWGEVDYGMLVKVYGQTSEGRRRYSPPECIGAEKMRVMGHPTVEDTCTSHVERQNLNIADVHASLHPSDQRFQQES